MAGLCEGGNESSVSLKARKREEKRREEKRREEKRREEKRREEKRREEKRREEKRREILIESTESYQAFSRIELRENPGKNLNQVTCPDRDSNPGHLVSRPDALTVTPQVWTRVF
ncbi:hypothetical protein ANN_25790 [Periplaneta americana]|uniref:Uncharacterized protein n=1 Tax=Periplaneta americana TaxID=6978 RepID=A0ABQ8S4I3_PERAM|nr:hypothetical protein ANN_25790 [Periplaneta americana]